jgi:hypothetical protein
MLLRGENLSTALGASNDIRFIPRFVTIDQLIYKLKLRTHIQHDDILCHFLFSL